MLFFSIIIPTFNSEATIDDCLQSVLSQTFKDFEILIIDGLSKDMTIEKIIKFNDDRIKIVSETDYGIYDAMNKGINLSKGEWLYFLGSDDILYDKNVLTDIYKKIEVEIIDVIYGNVLMKPSNRIYDGLFTYEKMQTVTLCHQAIFYKNKIFKDFGLYNTKYKVLADHDLNLKWFFSNKHKSIFVDRIIACYSETGYSSVYVDKEFKNDFSQKLLKYGINKFSILRLKELAIETSINKKKHSKLFSYFLYLSLYYMFRIIDLFKRKILNT